MLETRGPQDSALPSPRGKKRRPSESLLHPKPKRQALVKNPQPTINWDRLSKIWLTKSALRELDRRNSLLQTDLSSAEQHPQPEQEQPTTLKRFARGGGPDLTGLRGYTWRMSSSSRSRRSRKVPSGSPANRRESANVVGDRQESTNITASSGRKSSAYDGHFREILVANNIWRHDKDRKVKPDNLAEIQKAVRQQRASPPADEDEWERWRTSHDNASIEADLMTHAIPMIMGSRKWKTNRVMNNYSPLISDSMVAPRPDMCSGSGSDAFPAPLASQLSGSIEPFKDRSMITPNWFGEVKGRDGSENVAFNQSCYDAAYGARGLHELRVYAAGSQAQYDNKAYTGSMTYTGSVIRTFVSWPVPPSDSTTTPGYRTALVTTHEVADSLEQYNAGRAAARNMFDWAEITRDAVHTAAAARFHQQQRERFFEADEVQQRPEGPHQKRSRVSGNAIDRLEEVSEDDGDSSDAGTDELASSQ